MPRRAHRRTRDPRRALRPSLNNRPGTPPHPLLLERFKRIMDHGMNPGEPDLGVAPLGTLRPLIGGFYDSSKAWYLQTCWSHDRTLKEWLDLIEEKKQIPSIFWNISLTTPDHPWNYLRTQAKDIEDFFYRNQRMRWIARKWIWRVRSRMYSRKRIGEEDFCTLLPIPEYAQVSVLDFKNRCTYIYHFQSIMKSVQSQLLYSCYGFPEPRVPVNPYTNVPFTINQIISIFSQCSRCLDRRHKFLPTIFLKFRLSNYIIRDFLKNEKSQLNIFAAVNFFKNKDDVDAREMLIETFDDFIESQEVRPSGYLVARRKLREGTLTNYDLWVQLLTSFWIFTTHRIVWKYTVQNIKDEIYNLMNDLLKDRSLFPGHVRVPLPAASPPEVQEQEQEQQQEDQEEEQDEEEQQEQEPQMN